MLLVNIFKQVCNFQSIETMLSRARLSLSSGKVRLTRQPARNCSEKGKDSEIVKLVARELPLF